MEKEQSGNGYSGSMSICFPCRLKSDALLNKMNKRWRHWRNCQIKTIHHYCAPLTDLMDKESNRYVSEAFLSEFQNSLKSKYAIDLDGEYAPYGLKCLQSVYRKNREDNIFSKNIQLLLSRFSLKYSIRNTERQLTCNGALLLNVNADNYVASLIVVLNFLSFSAMDIIYLKHVFYKRLLVDITEYDTAAQDCDCSECEWMGCRKILNAVRKGKMTIQDYVNDKGKEVSLLKRLSYDIDYRARYSFIELNEEFTMPNKNFKLSRLRELYGIMMSDEGYAFVPQYKVKLFDKNYSTRDGYGMYILGLNTMILTFSIEDRKLCKQNHWDFERGYEEPTENIKTTPIEGACIPGVLEEYFPSFLKASEIHYLINKVTTNEIAIHERSFLNPFIFLKRLKLLWEILYDVDSHKYHVNKDFYAEFGISGQLVCIKDEYSNLLNHTVSYFMIVLTVIAAMFTFVQLWK